NEKWYADQLQVLLTGTIDGKPIVPPVQSLVYEKGVLVLDPRMAKALADKGVDPRFALPQLRPVADRTGQPLPALARLDEEYQKTNGEIAATMKLIADRIQQERNLTLELMGEGPRKGLRRQLAEEQAETEKSVAEQEYLKPLFYNRQAEAQLLQQRQKALQKRLQ